MILTYISEVWCLVFIIPYYCYHGCLLCHWQVQQINCNQKGIHKPILSGKRGRLDIGNID